MRSSLGSGKESEVVSPDLFESGRLHRVSTWKEDFAEEGNGKLPLLLISLIAPFWGCYKSAATFDTLYTHRTWLSVQ